MSQYIKKIRTDQGDLQIDYNALANLPTISNPNLLINSDLLSCQDYKQKVAAISTLKNGDGCWHLYNNICSPNFLRSKNFYK